jgi:uncharacterized protein
MSCRLRLRPLALPAALTLAMTSLAAAAGAAEPLRLATGGVTGVYHALGSALCRLLEPDLPTRLERCVVLSSEGSLDNLRRVRTGAAELTLAQAPLVRDAVAGSGAFAGDGPDDTLRVLFAPLVETLAIVVRADEPVAELEDLGGRRIDLGPPGSGSRATVMRLVGSADIDPEAFLALASPTSALSAETLCRGASDAFAFVGASPNSVVQEALAACPTRLVPVEGRWSSRSSPARSTIGRRRSVPGTTASSTGRWRPSAPRPWSSPTPGCRTRPPTG